MYHAAVSTKAAVELHDRLIQHMAEPNKIEKYGRAVEFMRRWPRPESGTTRWNDEARSEWETLRLETMKHPEQGGSGRPRLTAI